MSHFAETIMERTYAHEINGVKETWEEITDRVVSNVMSVVKIPKDIKDQIKQFIVERKFIPGGRYLYASGRPYHQTNNCFLFRAQDSREGWANLNHKANMSLMTGGGIGINYSLIRPEGAPIRKTGGFATGPISLMKMIDYCGDSIMQGGSRRSAIWAGLNWRHPDIHKFIHCKNWSREIRALKEQDFTFHAPLEGTNISVCLDNEFFEAYNDDKHVLHSMAHAVFWDTMERMLKTSEPGFSIDVDENKDEDLRNAPISANTYVLTIHGYIQVRDVINQQIKIWTGKQWANTIFKKTGENINVIKINMSGRRSIVCEPNHEFILDNGKRTKAKYLKKDDSLFIGLPNSVKIKDFRKDYYTLGFLYGDGSFYKRNHSAEVTLCTEDKKLCGNYFDKTLIGSINESDNRGYKRIYFNHPDFSWEILRNRYKEVFPEDLYFAAINEKVSFIAGLFDADGSYDINQHRIRLGCKYKEFLHGIRRLLEGLGILSSVIKGSKSGYTGEEQWSLVINASYHNIFTDIIPTKRLHPEKYKPYRKTKIKVISIEQAGIEDVYCCDVGVEEHSFMAEGVIISNCCEITSKDDGDVCNLGSINMSKIESLEEMKDVVECATIFLLAGTIYSDVPFAKIDQVRSKNRRIGLGLMGLHEWLLKNGKTYGIDQELDKYLKIYNKNKKVAHEWANKWDISKPAKTRAIAPNGTISIVGETTSSIEPVFCSAYKRRYLKGTEWHYQYVIDSIAEKLIQDGINPDNIEDAYSLAEEPERRIEFQTWIQSYVDHAISSTMNIPAWQTKLNNEDTVHTFGNMILKYLPKLRGLTIYTDKSRGGQPLTPVKYTTAKKHIGQVFSEVSVCDITKSGSCGE